MGLQGEEDSRRRDRALQGETCSPGFAQRPGQDYHEVFPPTMRWASIRMILALGAFEDEEMEGESNKSESGKQRGWMRIGREFWKVYEMIIGRFFDKSKK